MSVQKEPNAPASPATSAKNDAKSSRIFDTPGRRAVSGFLLTAAATVIVVAGLKAASALIAPILLALFLTIILLVPLRWLQQKGCPRSLALLLVLGGTVLIFLGIGYFVGQSFNDFARRVPAYKDRIVKKIEDLEDKLTQYGFVLTDLTKNLTGKPQTAPPASETDNVPVAPGTSEKPGEPAKSAEPAVSGEETAVPDALDDPEALDDPDDPSILNILNAHPDAAQGDEILPLSDEELQQFLSSHQQATPSLIPLDTKSVMYWVSWSIGELRHWAEGGFLVLIFTIFMLLEASRFPGKIDRAFGKEGPLGFAHFHHIAEEIRRYLFLKAISSLMSASAATLVYWMFGVPATLFWGILAFFLYFIPNIGGTLAAIIPGLLIFMTYNVEGVLLYIVCLVTIECAIAYGIEPKMLGHGLGLSVVVILLSLFTWGWILGPIGLFLSAPLTIMVKIVLQAFKETEWIAILLGDKVRDTGPT